ncbi:MAG: hypothetical protein QM784_36755 [Polyangiaceae bacterium]
MMVRVDSATSIPWREEENLIATGVGQFEQRRANTTDTVPPPQALWLIEKGQLRLRQLDGKLLVSIGKDVTKFTQGAYSQLRIAFISGGNLFEAVEPAYQPVPLQADACEPSYSGTLLSFLSPCLEKQLLRIDLTTGTTETFSPGVYAQFETRGFLFERQRGIDDEIELFVTPPGACERRITPALDNIQVLDANTIAGTDPDFTLGVWTFQAGFQPVLRNVSRAYQFVDSRTSALLWLVHHDVKDGLGTVSLLEQSKLQITTLAKKVPAAGGYAIGGLQQVPELVLMVLRNAKPFTFDTMGNPTRFRGTLEVSLLSGALPAKIDSDVSSYTLVFDTEAGGLLYAIDSGAKQGLWFAAL